MEANNIFTTEEKAMLLDFIFRYATNHRKCHGSYSIDDEKVNLILVNNDVYRGTCKKKEDKEKSREHNNWLLFEQDKKKGIEDVAHDLMRHIRNSIAHWYIKEKDSVLLLEDYHEAKKSHRITKTLDGKIEKKLLFDLIEALEESKTDK